MRFFRKRDASPPQLVRLAILGESMSPNDSDGTPGYRLSLPSSFSECCLDELMAYPSPATNVGTPRTRRGFPFPWIGRKYSGPKKYAVTPKAYPYREPDELDSVPELNSTILRSAVSQTSLDDCSRQWPKSLKTFKKPTLPEKPTHSIYEKNSYPSSESLNNNNNNNCNINNNNEYIGNGNLKTSPKVLGMFRSVSTSALLEDPKQFYRSVDIDVSDNGVCCRHSPHCCCNDLSSKTSSCEDLIDRQRELSLDGGIYGKPASPIVIAPGATASPSQTLGTVLEEEVFLDGLTGSQLQHHSNSLNPTEDTESLASSIQHRSDESGYESDGAKNGNDESVITDIRTPESDAVASHAPVTDAAHRYSLSKITEPKFRAKRLLSPDSPLQERSPDTNLQKFASLFQRFTTATTPTSSRTNSYSVTPKKEECLPKHSAKVYEARSLRLKTPTVLSNFVQKQRESSTTTFAKDSLKSPTDDCGKRESRSNSRLGQFKAWTLDRKLLRSRWKKSPLPDEKLDVAARTKRSSIFESSLFPSSGEDSPTQLQMETKPLPLLSSSSENIYDSLHGDINPLKCGDLNYQLRLKKAGYRSASTANDTRRRLWLQSQLSASLDNNNAIPADPHTSNQNLVSPVTDKPCRIPSQLDLHEMVSVDLEKDAHGELGIYITGCFDSEKNILGYIIVDFEKHGAAEKNGKLLKGDELMMVNGKHLQGVDLEEARQLLRVPDTHVHLLIARELTEDLSFKEDSSRMPLSLPPVPELHESNSLTDNEILRLRSFQSSTSSTNRLDNRHSHPDFSSKPKTDNESVGNSGICTLPRRSKSAQLTLHTVVFEKGPGKKSLGFSIVGGKDSPKGELGFYVKTIFSNGQAAETGCLKEGDEIYTLNGQSLQGLSHSEAIGAFKKIKQGDVVLHIGRRSAKRSSSLVKTSSRYESNNNVSKSCSMLDNLHD